MASRVTAETKKSKKTALPVVGEIINLDTARFECTFGRGCDGICCSNSRPPIDKAEELRIQKGLKKILPLLKPKAAKLVAREGFVSKRKKFGGYSLRVVDTWCVFFNQGCVLHKLGAQEGDTMKYKPLTCALFPLERYDDQRWYIRQAGFAEEKWDLFCLKPTSKTPPARETLAWEISLAKEHDQGKR